MHERTLTARAALRHLQAAMPASLAVALLTCLAGCGSGNDGAPTSTGSEAPATTPAQAPATPPTAAPSSPSAASPSAAAPPSSVALGSPPSLVFDRPEFDFGRIMETDTVTATFTVSNSGGSPLRIQDIKTSCGCTVAEVASWTIQPGGSTTLSAEYKPNQVSTNDRPMIKYVTLRTNDPQQPTARCQIRAIVDPFISIQPANLLFGVRPLGDPFVGRLTISATDPGFEILSVDSENTDVDVRLLTADEAMMHLSPGAPTQARVLQVSFPETMPWGGSYFGIQVVGKGRPRPSEPVIEHTSTIRVGGRFFGVLHGTSDRFGVAGRPGQPIDVTRSITRNDGQPLTIVEAMVVDWNGGSPLEVQVQRVSQQKWDVRLVGRGPSRDGTYAGSVVLVTDVEDPREREIRMPIHVPIRSG